MLAEVMTLEMYKAAFERDVSTFKNNCLEPHAPSTFSIVRGSSAARGVLDGLGHCSSRLQLSRKTVTWHVKCLGIAHLDRCSWKDWMEGVREWWYVSYVNGGDVLPLPPSTNHGKHDIDLSPPGEKALLAMVIHHRWSLGDECWFIGISLGILAFQIAPLRASRTHSRGQVGWFDVFWEWDIQSSVSKRKLYRKSKIAMSSCPLYRLQTCDLVVIPREN